MDNPEKYQISPQEAAEFYFVMFEIMKRTSPSTTDEEISGMLLTALENRAKETGDWDRYYDVLEAIDAHSESHRR